MRYKFGYLFALKIFLFVLPTLAARLPVQESTTVPIGPLHVDRNRIVDSRGRAILLRGSQLPNFSIQATLPSPDPKLRFGPYSATTFSTIRQRWNMNAVRLALNIIDDERDPNYLNEVERVVRRANELELLVILAAHEPGADLPSGKFVRFWDRCAGFFKNYPNVIFDAFSNPEPSFIPGHVEGRHSALDWKFWLQGRETLDGRTVPGMQALVNTIRAAGATQPIAVMGWDDGALFEGLTPEYFVRDSNIIYEVCPRYRTTRTDEDRRRQFGFLGDRVPVLANDWDVRLDKESSDCASIPADPSLAEALVQGNLNYFDAHNISWTASVFETGKLITDYWYQDATTLENGWTCGEPSRPLAGMGALVQFHLWGGETRGLFAVNGSGNLLLPRGGVAIAYGPILAERDSRNTRPVLPTSLGKVSVKVTDHLGKARLAGLLFASAGWGQINFVVPPGTAAGPARIAIERDDGTSVSAPTTIADVAPGLWTSIANSRGPVIGYVTQSSNGKSSTFPAFRCSPTGCDTVPIRLLRNGSTKVRLLGTGIRNAASVRGILVKIGGIPVPVTAFGATADPGVDDITVELTPPLRGLGETDLICSINGRLSNVVRINVDPR